jgi:hypothetical protein
MRFVSADTSALIFVDVRSGLLLRSLGAAALLLVVQIQKIPGPESALEENDPGAENEQDGEPRSAMPQVEPGDHEQYDDQVPQPR